MKKIHFLSGLPRSGNTVLSALLNQHPDIYSSPLSPMCEGLWSVKSLLENNEHYLRNSNPKGLRTALNQFFYGYYSSVDEPIILDREKVWTTPANLNLILECLTPAPKVIFTVRNLLEILASWVSLSERTGYLTQQMVRDNWFPVEYLPLNDAKCDYLMDSKARIMQLPIYALSNAMKKENRHFVHFVDYNDLINNPGSVMKGIYSFLEVPFYENDFSKLIKFEHDNEASSGDPEGLHTIRPMLQKISKDPSEVLSEYVVQRYARYDFWTGRV